MADGSGRGRRKARVPSSSSRWFGLRPRRPDGEAHGACRRRRGAGSPVPGADAESERLRRFHVRFRSGIARRGGRSGPGGATSRHPDARYRRDRGPETPGEPRSRTTGGGHDRARRFVDSRVGPAGGRRSLSRKAVRQGRAHRRSRICLSQSRGSSRL